MHVALINFQSSKFMCVICLIPAESIEVNKDSNNMLFQKILKVLFGDFAFGCKNIPVKI